MLYEVITDDRPLHLPVTPEQVAIARCPVISDNLIAEAEVVSSRNGPPFQ